MLIKLNDEQKNELRKDISGNGGFQSLMIELQNKFDSSASVLIINNQELLEKVIKYAYQYKSGGYQNRLKKILDLN